MKFKPKRTITQFGFKEIETHSLPAPDLVICQTMTMPRMYITVPSIGKGGCMTRATFYVPCGMLEFRAIDLSPISIVLFNNV